jgi:ElaB/YqjD/DUF883 family membrane-anchored ribosome-binding protein
VKDFEQLGAFYLGGVDGDPKAPFLYDSKDLTTHGFVVGMTGSGKTGLSIVLLEEAALDGIPALIIDPKGDMGNLMLQFPELEPEDFRPWVDNAEATRRGVTPEAFAAETAAVWERGLGEWGQSKRRIVASKSSAQVRIYTPGSTAGRPIALLRAFDAPPAAVREDDDALRERVLNAASGLLGLVGIDADPVTSREHILLSTLLIRAWRDGEDRDLETILREIQQPSFETLGVLDLESFFPAKDRFALAARLNNLLASPAFAAWREGEPLDIPRLLYTDSGKPRLAILSIAHLSDQERMFFVTLFLNEVISWMRSLEGTGSLRAIVYMDEIFGYFPPVANPPSKSPMLTLLKQARAYGVGVLLATQNPVDLDYKGLANIGTWFLGRLQTARDRDRLMDGLATAASGAAFNRKHTEELLASLDKRVFLMQNVHEDAPVVFKTRWALSYLRGPLTLQQIKDLTGARDLPSPPPQRPRSPGAAEAVSTRPRAPEGIEECFLASSSGAGELVYEPHLLASLDLHYVSSAVDVDHWTKLHWLTPLAGEAPEWSDGEALPSVTCVQEPNAASAFALLPKTAESDKTYVRWQKSCLAHLYRERTLVVYRCKKLEMCSQPGETEGQFRGRLTHALHQKRDEELSKLRARYGDKLKKLQERVEKAGVRVARETDQYSATKRHTVISIGETLVGALFGRKLGSLTNVGRASRTARSASRASQERDDVARAEKALNEAKEKLRELESDLATRTSGLRSTVDASQLAVDEVPVRFRKSDTTVARFALAWRALEDDDA